MSKLLGTVDLIRGAPGLPEPAKIYVGFDERHMRDQEMLWKPLLTGAFDQVVADCREANGQINEQKFYGEVARLGIGDVRWDWRKIHRDYHLDPGTIFIAIECAGRTQGLMYLECEIHATRLLPKGEQLIYIDRVAVAPWNRVPLSAAQEYRGVGRLLVGLAINVSLEKKYDGRIGLHSLHGAQSFYRTKCGMTDLGTDAMKEGLNYFEMSETQAQLLLSRKAHLGGGP